MGSLKLYDTNIPREHSITKREVIYLQKSAEEKLYFLLKLIRVSVYMNGGKPLKTPEGKGIVIKK